MSPDKSLPVRERGLKPKIGMRFSFNQQVAPRAGAWIETRAVILLARQYGVAPRAGAWIET